MKFVAINEYNQEIIAISDSLKSLKEEIKSYLDNSDPDEIYVYTLTHNVSTNKTVVISEIKG